jgi:ABC-type Mn2+/Zn2+ transport system ATPase subunit
MLVEAHDAVFGYGKRPVVRVDHLHLDAGRSLGIFGPNGSGKTTLVRGVSGLLQPLGGSVTRKPDLRIGYLPQYRHLDLAWPMTGLDAALLATSARRRLGWVGNQRTATLAMLQRLGVASLASSRFSTLSGGQQQRILLSGAMAADPEVLLLDEPTDGLDVHSRQKLLDLLREFTSAGLATVIISHDVEDLLTVCDQIARLHPGKDVDQPAAVEIIPPEEFARQLTALSTHAHPEPRP